MSDPHGETETMTRLNSLAKFDADCEVVALTGDCVSRARPQVPREWDEWPQRLKFSVPGNHDHADTFDQLRTWKHQAPWACRVEDLLFVGVGLSLSESTARCLSSRGSEDVRGIVLLCHERPRLEEHRLANMVSAFVGLRELLILHGDEHPWTFSGAEWDESGVLGDRHYYRSRIYSAKSGRRGLCHRILWFGDAFRCVAVQGSMAPIRLRGPVAEHQLFGKGAILETDGAGDAAKLTIDFPCFGVKRIFANHSGLKFLDTGGYR
jgi:hypothetical protein